MSRKNVQLHLKRSPRHLTSSATFFRSPLSECLAAQFIFSPSQLSLLRSFSSPFKPPWLPRAKVVSPLTKNYLLPPRMTPFIWLHLPSHPASPLRTKTLNSRPWTASIPKNSPQLLALPVLHIPVFLMLQLLPSPAPSTPFPT